MTNVPPPPAVSTAPASTPTWLRVFLIVIAAVETFGTVAGVSNVFVDYGHTTPLLIFAQAVTKAQLALSPLFAATALFFAVTGRLRYAVMALAGLFLLAWVADLPAVAIHGLEIDATIGGLGVFGYRFIYPLLAIMAIVLAYRNERLVVAGLLVSLPTLSAWAGVLAFAIAVSIYGF